MKDNKMYGIFAKVLNDPSVNIIAKDAGLDFIFYDMEHGMYTYERLHDLIITANALSFPSYVRVPQLAKGDVSRVLDAGAKGVMVPMIETLEQAKQLVQYAKYPPIGGRSYSGGANTFYQREKDHRKAMDEMNQEIVVIAQIETMLGVSNVEEIAKLEGIDALLIGPADLSISLGIPNEYHHEEMKKSIHKIIAACRKNKKQLGMIANLSMMEEYYEDLDILVSAIDIHILKEGFEKAVMDLQAFEKK